MDLLMVEGKQLSDRLSEFGEAQRIPRHLGSHTTMVKDLYRQ